MAPDMPTRLELEKLKIPDLKKLCKDKNITGYSKLNKKDLLEKLINSSNQASGIITLPITASDTEVHVGDPPEFSAYANTLAAYANHTSVFEHTSRAPPVSSELQTYPSLTTPILKAITSHSSETSAQFQARVPDITNSTTTSSISDSTSKESSYIPPTPHLKPDLDQAARTPFGKPQEKTSKRKTVDPSQPEHLQKKSKKVKSNQENFGFNSKSKVSSSLSPSAIVTGSQKLPRLDCLPNNHTSTLSLTRNEPQPGATLSSNKEITAPPAPVSGSRKTEATKPSTATPKRIPTKFAPLKVSLPIATKQTPIAKGSVDSLEKTLDFPPDTPISVIKDTLKTSFLERFYHANKSAGGVTTRVSTEMSFDGLAGQLLDGSHSTQAINIAIRFVIARIHTIFQLGESQDPVSLDPVIACQEYCKGIWTVFTHNERVSPVPAAPAIPKGRGRVRRTIDSDPVPQPTSTEGPRSRLVAYLVISETGDVITRSDKFRPLDVSLPVDLQKFTLRADWAAYIKTAQMQKTAGQAEEVLISRVKTKQSEDYPNGIALVWRKRIVEAGKHEELSVAERYILGNVVLNSVSGDLMSMTQMDSIWTGQGASDIQPKKWNSISLYLPESHQVEAVSFSTCINGKRDGLHPSVAIAARKYGEDLILRPTGQVIGDTDRGVDQLYQHIIGCDHRGVAVSLKVAEKMARDFWAASNTSDDN